MRASAARPMTGAGTRSALRPCMALREFTASDGRLWRVWDVRPETMHPATRTEDYLSAYLEGWLVFEAADESAKCRLHPIPPGWADADDAALEKMLHRAETIRGERTSGPHARVAADDVEVARPAPRSDEADSQVRGFRFPKGRFWSVAEWSTSVSGSAGVTRTVLRFTAGTRSLDLTEWPPDWRNFSDAQLAALLVSSFPRPGRPNPTQFRRRASDNELR
jgi:hypothetical protein